MGEDKREKLLLAAIVIFLIAGAGIWLWRGAESKAKYEKQVSVEDTLQEQTDAGAKAENKGDICVHIVGGVAQPGVYQLPDGSRLYELIEKAGGTVDGADTEAINMAEVIADGSQYRIPLKGESPQQTAQTGGSGGTSGADKIDINHADIQQLDKIPGVGEATAEKIVAFREKNGRFSKPEDLMEVPGIGEKKFDAMKDVITVK